MAADGGQLLVTYNGGSNWIVNQLATDPNIHFTALYFSNSRTGFIAAWGKIYKTTNAGVSIDTMNSYIDAYNSIHFPTPNTGYAVSRHIGIYKSTDSGYNWIRLKPPELSGPNSESIFFLNEMTGYIGGDYSLFGFTETTNGGLNWRSLNLNASLSDICFAFSIGFAVGSGNNGGLILKTSDNGGSWTAVAFSPAAGYLVGVTISSNSIIYTVDYNGILVKSTNGGTNWNVYNSNLHFITNICFVNESTGFLINGEGKIFKTTTGGVPIGIKPISNDIPLLYSLHQNYPNPFNPLTIIKFDVPYSSHSFREGSGVRLVIYDVLGKEVDVRVNEELKPGSYQVQWDATGFSSGVYYYKLISGDYSQTRKMVLIK